MRRRGHPVGGEDDCAAGVLEAADAVLVDHEAHLPWPRPEGSAVAAHDAEQVAARGPGHRRPEAANWKRILKEGTIKDVYTEGGGRSEECEIMQN